MIRHSSKNLKKETIAVNLISGSTDNKGQEIIQIKISEFITRW